MINDLYPGIALHYPTDDLPLYCYYDGRYQSQMAYIELDEEGDVRARYNPEIGNGVPADVYNGLTRRWTISREVARYLPRTTVCEFLDRLAPLLERVCQGHSVRWNGSNNVGRLDDDALEASKLIDRACYDLEADRDLLDAEEAACPRGALAG